MILRKLHSRSAVAVPTFLAVVLALALAAPAGAATTYPVRGKQIVVDENAGTYRMTGSLIGDWATTSFTTIATTPLFEGQGTELFSGCLDRMRDGSCAHDPSGTLSFSFTYVAQFAADDSLVWGTCSHPITGGTGAFAGATGVLAMVDTPTPRGVVTRYIGNVTLKGAWSARAHRSARTASSAAVHAC